MLASFRRGSEEPAVLGSPAPAWCLGAGAAPGSPDMWIRPSPDCRDIPKFRSPFDSLSRFHEALTPRAQFPFAGAFPYPHLKYALEGEGMGTLRKGTGRCRP